MWTLVVWVSRIRNIFGDEDLGAFDRTWRTGVAVVFIAFGVATAVALWRHRSGDFPASTARLLVAFVGWTVTFWVVRGTGILVDPNHDAGFKAVHTVLAVVSIGFAALALRGRARRRVESVASV